MSVYLDANVLVALLIPDSLTSKATAAIGKLTDDLIVSDIAALEVASTIAKKVRERAVSRKDGQVALASFDTWIEASERVQLEGLDVATADAMIRRPNVNLHGMDALHIALASRIGAVLLTLDGKMRASAKKVGLAVI